ncbi:hypothetical protein C8F04DRAFT_1244297 [Mycena alexandri]|uniref:Uncharacterized protein n=1 Tax=Mycena alexandri TaxID=1745969 RepID=A0AAD6RY59_9AGAR|nr:hypothetical protein C8F04DRAFT_1244297 [Mycena alexandri]
MAKPSDRSPFRKSISGLVQTVLPTFSGVTSKAILSIRLRSPLLQSFCSCPAGGAFSSRRLQDIRFSCGILQTSGKNRISHLFRGNGKAGRTWLAARREGRCKDWDDDILGGCATTPSRALSLIRCYHSRGGIQVRKRFIRPKSEHRKYVPADSNLALPSITKSPSITSHEPKDMTPALEGRIGTKRLQPIALAPPRNAMNTVGRLREDMRMGTRICISSVFDVLQDAQTANRFLMWDRYTPPSLSLPCPLSSSFPPPLPILLAKLRF